MLQQEALILMVLCCLSAYTAVSEGKHCKGHSGNAKLNCGRTKAASTRSTSNVRIIKAREAEKGAWPWMAEIFITRRNKSSPTCAGALLNHFYVATVAHCFMSRGRAVKPKDLTVRLGDHDLKSDKDGMKPINSNVTFITVHEDFDPNTYENDIALLRLGHAVNFSNHIQPICLPEEEDSLRDEERGTLSGYITGWGPTKYHGPDNNVLMEMSAFITNNEICREAYEGKAVITDRNICSMGVNGSGPCHGFSGAPMVFPGKDYRYHIVGIASFGIACGSTNYPDVHTRVSKYLDWIEKYAI